MSTLQNTNTHFWSYLAQFSLEWEKFQTEVVEKIKTFYVQYRVFFFFLNHAVYEIMWKNIVGPDRLHMPVWHMRISLHCMLDTSVYKHTLRIHNTYCFSTATVVARTHLNITLHIHTAWLVYIMCLQLYSKSMTHQTCSVHMPTSTSKTFHLTPI